MFGISFGWPKASKCKKVIKTARCRLRQLKNKRIAIATQMRKDLADLILNGHEETAVKRVEQLIQDESLVAAYELLDHFFEFILTQLSYIRKHKDCPADINEAVSSLIFASARCGDFPELYAFRKLFGQRYGREFATAAVELFPGNFVNKKIIESLSAKSVPDGLKYRVVAEIARDNGLQPKVKDYKGNQIVESDARIIDAIAGYIHSSDIEEIERDVTCVSLSITKPSDAFSLPKSTMNDTSALVCAVQQYPPYLRYSLQEKVEEVEDFPKLILFETFDLQNKGEIMALSFAERVSLLPYAEAVVDYADDIEECQYFVSKDCSCQDQSLLFDSDESDMDQGESTSEESSIRSHTERKRASKKRLRRSVLLESQGIMEIGYVINYQNPCRQQMKPLLERIPQSSYPQKRLKQHYFSEKEKCIESCQSQGDRKRNSFNFDMSDCSLDNPCYCCFYNDQECWEALSMKPKQGIRYTPIQQGVLLGEFCHCLPLFHDESNEGMELVAIPQKLNKENCGAARYHLLTCPDYQSGKPNNEIEASESLEGSSSTNVSNPKTSDSLTKTETTTPYSRALTMPPKWPNNCKDNLLMTYSSTSQQPKHVHPKLPDYDNFVATFTALKREYVSRG